MNRKWISRKPQPLRCWQRPRRSPRPPTTPPRSATARGLDADKQLDAERKPAQMLALAHVRPGMKGDGPDPGQRILSPALFSVAVGPKGYVYAYQPADLDGFLKGKTPPDNDVAAAYKNVAVIHASVNKLVAPESLTWFGRRRIITTSRTLSSRRPSTAQVIQGDLRRVEAGAANTSCSITQPRKARACATPRPCIASTRRW